MTEDEKKTYAYLVLKDLYKELNHAVNHLNIIREFMHDLLNLKDGNEPKYETMSVMNFKK